MAKRTAPSQTREKPATDIARSTMPSPETLDYLREQFERFRQDRLKRFQVKLRRKRAEQIRTLLANPAEVDVDTFNREVWKFESSTHLHGQEIKGQVFGLESPPAETIREWERALDGDKLKLHGNYIWTSGANVFGPTYSTSEQRDSISQALALLNEAELTPHEKAQRIEKLRGFGPNSATGLVMIFHPVEYMIGNTPSREALGQLGYAAKSPEAFQECARALKAALGAEDFLELDWFLYRLGPPPPRRSVWLFQANPKFYDLAKELTRVQPGDEDDWSVTRYRSDIKAGDTVLLWQAGKEAGIYAVCQVVGKPFQGAAGPWKQQTAEAQTEWRVKLCFTRILRPPIPRTELLNHPVLREMDVLRAPQGTNFRVSDSQWEAIKCLIEDQPPPPPPVEPSFAEIHAKITGQGLRISDRLLRRYHLALKCRGFVILAGLSGTGKTWLAQEYARAVGAEHCLVPVAPNWTANEDLLGYFNPLGDSGGRYYDTAFSGFLRRAAQEYEAAQTQNRAARPFHLILDEMNLARVEYYFARFLSAMEIRARGGQAAIELGPNDSVPLPPNLFFIGTVNMDETTHGFADKVFDRAQLIELEAPRDLLVAHLDGAPYQDLLMSIWDAVSEVAPFAFRVLDEIRTYVDAAEKEIHVEWKEALDEQILQKVLPKLKGAEATLGEALTRVVALTESDLPISHSRARRMLEGYRRHGFAFYFKA